MKSLAGCKDPSYTEIVQVAGVWSGTFVLRIDESVATMAAGAMLGIPLEQVSPKKPTMVGGFLSGGGDREALRPLVEAVEPE